MQRPPRVGINGFGRIGRLVVRALLSQPRPVDIVGINDVTTPQMLAHLFRYDSVHGMFQGTIEADGTDLVFNGDRIRILTAKTPRDLPWRELQADYVIESTGKYSKQADLQGHLDAGARRVILTAPGEGVDVTIVRGVNLDRYDPQRHRTVSNASCTTNCLAPLLKVLHDAFRVEQGVMTTIHAYTNDQRLLDSPHSDPRRARAAALSMVPTSTGAAKAIGLVLPELDGKVTGMAIRVPTPNVSVVDLTARVAKRVTVEEVAAAFEQAAAGPLQGILRCEREELVSIDFNHDPYSAVVDMPTLTVVDGYLVKVLAWYDNEWAYACRVAELLHDVAQREPEEAGSPVVAAASGASR